MLAGPAKHVRATAQTVVASRTHVEGKAAVRILLILAWFWPWWPVRRVRQLCSVHACARYTMSVTPGTGPATGLCNFSAPGVFRLPILHVAWCACGSRRLRSVGSLGAGRCWFCSPLSLWPCDSLHRPTDWRTSSALLMHTSLTCNIETFSVSRFGLTCADATIMTGCRSAVRLHGSESTGVQHHHMVCTNRLYGLPLCRAPCYLLPNAYSSPCGEHTLAAHTC